MQLIKRQNQSEGAKQLDSDGLSGGEKTGIDALTAESHAKKGSRFSGPAPYK